MKVDAIALQPPRRRGSPRAAPGEHLPPSMAAAVRAAVDANRARRGPLLPVLHAVQEALGYVPPETLPLIAFELNLTRAEVHGVVSFYHHFRSTPPGRTVVQLCRAEACQALGARELEAHAKRSLGVDWHGTTADGAVTLEPVYCLGNCGCGPSLLVGADELHARVDAAAFDAIVAAARQEKAL